MIKCSSQDLQTLNHKIYYTCKCILPSSVYEEIPTQQNGSFTYRHHPHREWSRLRCHHHHEHLSTVVNNDIMSAAWFNDVNSKIASLNAKVATLEAGGNGRISNYQIVTNSSGYQNLHYNTDVYCPAGTIVF